MVKDPAIKKVILDIVERLKERYQPEKIILYGSFAYGEPNEDSDIDLLIIKDTGERPIDRRIAVRTIVSDIRGGFPFSPLVVTPAEVNSRLEIGDQFFETLLSRGEVLYAR